MHDPMFSVVTCCYNQGEFLADNIEAVLAQDYPRFEHIVVDDGSKDNTREVCARYPHVKYIYQTNAGQSAALNRGFQEATGDIIAWVNSDDYFEPGTFARVAAEYETGDSHLIVCGASKVVNAKGDFLWLLKNGWVPFKRLLLHPRLYPYNGWTVMPCQPSTFFHRDLIKDCGLLDTSLKYAMDYDLWLRAMRRGYHFRYVPQVFSSYRYHATSNSNQGFDTFQPEWKRVSEAHYKALSHAEQRAVERWWAYARIESLFVRQHKKALRHYGERVGPHPAGEPLARRLAVFARACTIAPWLPVLFAWYLLVGSPEQRLMQYPPP